MYICLYVGFETRSGIPSGIRLRRKTVYPLAMTGKSSHDGPSTIYKLPKGTTLQ